MAPTKKPPATSQAAQLVALLDAVPFYRLARTPDEELWYKPGNGHWLRVGSPEFESFALSLWIAVRKNVPLMKITSEAAASSAGVSWTTAPASASAWALVRVRL